MLILRFLFCRCRFHLQRKLRRASKRWSRWLYTAGIWSDVWIILVCWITSLARCYAHLCIYTIGACRSLLHFVRTASQFVSFSSPSFLLGPLDCYLNDRVIASQVYSRFHQQVRGELAVRVRSEHVTCVTLVPIHVGALKSVTRVGIYLSMISESSLPRLL